MFPLEEELICNFVSDHESMPPFHVSPEEGPLNPSLAQSRLNPPVEEGLNPPVEGDVDFSAMVSAIAQGEDGSRISVLASSETNIGVSASSRTNIGVSGSSGTNIGVSGSSKTNVGVSAGSENGIGLLAKGGRLAANFIGDVEVTDDIRLINADCIRSSNRRKRALRRFP